MVDLDVALLEYFHDRHAELAAVYLYGSQARGCAREDSDVDLALLYADEPPAGLQGLGLDIAGELEGVLAKEVDLIVLNRSPADLAHRVLREGRLVLERDRARRIRFEVRVRNEYFDLQPVLARYRCRGAQP